MFKTITAEALAELTRQAGRAERRRAHLNVHDSPDAPVQRFFIAMEPDTYIRPHRHLMPETTGYAGVNNKGIAE